MNNLADAFASSFFFRILLPGLVAAAGLHPFLTPLAVSAVNVYPIDLGTLFLVEVVFFGLLAYAATIPVYHVLHGETLRFLTRPFESFTERKLNRYYTRLVGLYDRRDYDDLSEAARAKIRPLHTYLSDFPLKYDESEGPYYVLRSTTRLGNIINAYTLYPETRYGIRAVDFWNHIPYTTPIEVRKELDGIEAIAQGMVLSALAAWIVLVVALVTGACRIVGGLVPRLTIGAAPVDDPLIACLMLGAIVCVVLFNFLAREAHRDFGRHFKAAFDVYAQNFMEWVSNHTMPFPEENVDRARDLSARLRHLQGRLDTPSSGGEKAVDSREVEGQAR